MPVIESKTINCQGVLTEADPVLDWIDRELHEASRSGWQGSDNVLLELRQVFRNPSPGSVVSRFFRLLPRLEKRHFLLGFRIRQWVALRFEMLVSDPLGRVSEVRYPLDPLARVLPRVKSHFFEHATQLIPLGDIRVTIVPVNSLKGTALP